MHDSRRAPVRRLPAHRRRRHRRGRRPRRRPADPPARPGGQLDRVAGLAPRPGPGRPRRRRRRARAGVDRAGLRRPLRPALRRAATPASATPAPTWRKVRADADLLAAYLDGGARADRRLPRGRSGPTTSTGSSTSAGTRRSRSACGWSASSTTTASTSARRRTSGGCSAPEASEGRGSVPNRPVATEARFGTGPRPPHQGLGRKSLRKWPYRSSPASPRTIGS